MCVGKVDLVCLFIKIILLKINKCSRCMITSKGMISKRSRCMKRNDVGLCMIMFHVEIVGLIPCFHVESIVFVLRL